MSCEPLTLSWNRTCGEGGEGTLSLSALIFNALGSGDGVGAPNFPPHDLGEFDRLKIAVFWKLTGELLFLYVSLWYKIHVYDN
jgi:hypothetical protein